MHQDSRLGHLATIEPVSDFTPPFGREQIEKLIPHREPFLLIDEIVELEPGARVVARSTIRGDEWFLRGHFLRVAAFRDWNRNLRVDRVALRSLRRHRVASHVWAGEPDGRDGFELVDG